MDKHPNCAERCQQGFNAVMNAISDEKDYCDCGAVHTGHEDGGRCEACGKII